MITQEYIDDIIKNSTVEIAKMGKKTTVVHFTLPNGFEIVETAACVNPDDYNQEIGEQIATKRIIDKIWLLEGYLLQQSLTVR